MRRALLALLVIAAYARVAGNGFVGLDDEDYVTGNPRVLAGLTWDGIAWAFTTTRAANWHPLTWISHMIDVELFGLHAGAHHLVSLAIHAASTLVLFHLLARTTGKLGPSTFVAAAFGLHPLHVESVAWAAERKDVLGGLFWMLTTLAYVSGRRATTVVLYALGLMAKPMLVTLPFTLLLLDVWPLRRKPRLLEKAPLFALSAASCVVTFLVQRSAGAMHPAGSIPFALRVENALVACVAYLGKAVAPFGLTVFYPHPGSSLPIERVLLAVLAIAVATVLAVRFARTRPWLAVGWLWFLGTLVPVLGLVQVGSQAMADRYTYIPLIGASIAVAFSELRVPRVAVVALVLLWGGLTWRQVGVWRDTETLFGHALEVVPENYLARGALGVDRLREGRLQEAEAELREAIRIEPDFALGHANLGAALEGLGRPEEAEREYREAIRLEPRLAQAHQNLGRLLGIRGRTDQAIAHLEEALRHAPDSVFARFNLGVALLAAGRREEGIASLERVLELDPSHAAARAMLARAR